MRLWNVFVEDEIIWKTPSFAQDVSESEERQLRAYGCELISCAGILLRHSVFVINHAMVLFHRYYYSSSFRDADVWGVAQAALYVASKLEEDQRRIMHVVAVFRRMRLRYLDASLIEEPMSDEEYVKYAFRFERDLLKQIGYVCYVEQPHRFVIPFCNIIFKDIDESLLKAIRQKAWNYINDSFRTTLCCRFPGENVACGAVYLAARQVGITLPKDIPWTECLDTSVEALYAVVQELLELYTQPAPQYISLLPFAEYSRIKEEKAEKEVRKREREQREEADEARRRQERRREEERRRDAERQRRDQPARRDDTRRGNTGGNQYRREDERRDYDRRDNNRRKY